MSLYLKQFENHTQYENYINGSDAILPNVSICTTEGDVHYNPYVEPAETRVVAKFNVTSTSSPTPISYYKSSKWGITDGSSGFSAIEIDGVEQPNVVTSYTFSTTGEHTVKYTLKDPTNIVIFAFRGCSSLTSVTIPDSVTSIGADAFYDCRSLTSINIPSGVTSIGSEAFYNCYGLTSCTIGNGVTSIGNNTFYNCSGLTSCTIGSGVTSIGESAFHTCRSLTSIDIPNSVTSIGGFAFQNCSGLTSCTIGSGVTSIGANVFYGCSSLTSVTIPDSVTSIGNNTFYNCSGLTSVTVNAVTPPTLGSSVFGNTNDCPIYVPSESVETYKAASGWSDYAADILPIQ